jgi:hypothetical protein
MASRIGKAPCLPCLKDSPVLDRDNPSCFPELKLPCPLFPRLCLHVFLSKQKTASIERKFDYFPSLTLYCLKPQSILQALCLKAVSELRKEIAIDISNTDWRTFAKLGGE